MSTPPPWVSNKPPHWSSWRSARFSLINRPRSLFVGYRVAHNYSVAYVGNVMYRRLKIVRHPDVVCSRFSLFNTFRYQDNPNVRYLPQFEGSSVRLEYIHSIQIPFQILLLIVLLLALDWPYRYQNTRKTKNAVWKGKPSQTRIFERAVTSNSKRLPLISRLHIVLCCHHVVVLVDAPATPRYYT
jgi:hypothetical protein